MKQQYNTPQLAIINVHVDILTSSVPNTTLNNNRGFGAGETVGAPTRRSIWE